MRVRLTSPQEPAVAAEVNIGLLHLYYNPGSIPAQYSLHGSHVLSHIATHNLKPMANALQRQITAMFPRTSTIHCHIGHVYFVLHLIDSLWQVKSQRLSTSRSAIRDGIRLTWPTTDLQTALYTAPTLNRIYGGSETLLILTSELATHREMRRELSHSIYTASLFSSLDTYNVWAEKGKAIFRTTSWPSNPYTHIIETELIRTKPYASNLVKPRVIIHAIPQELVDFGPDIPRHIIPKVKGTAHITFDSTQKILATILDEALYGRILPILAVDDLQDHKVAIYGLSLDTAPYIALYTRRNRRTSRNALPLITPIPDSPYYSPNRVLAKILRHLLFHDYEITKDPNNIARWHSMRRLMWSFGYKTIQSYASAFLSWSLPLDSSEIHQLHLYSAILE